MVIGATKDSEYANITHEEKPIFGLSSTELPGGLVREFANKVIRRSVPS